MRSVFYIHNDLDDLCLFEYAFSEVDTSSVVYSFAESSNAFRLFDKGVRPDIIFIHIPLLKISAQDCLSIIRRYKQLQDVPVILQMEDYADDERHQYIKFGATDIIFMPKRLYDLKNQILFVIQSYLEL